MKEKGEQEVFEVVREDGGGESEMSNAHKQDFDLAQRTTHNVGQWDVPLRNSFRNHNVQKKNYLLC